jgi:putative SOS response-associated peptidase YedK
MHSNGPRGPASTGPPELVVAAEVVPLLEDEVTSEPLVVEAELELALAPPLPPPAPLVVPPVWVCTLFPHASAESARDASEASNAHLCMGRLYARFASMCGRYTLSYEDLGAVVEALDAILDPAAAELHRPRFNIAPSNACVVATRVDALDPAGDHPALVPAIWGIRRDERLIINVRSENVASRFHRAYAQHRCVVPADGFYEWTGEKGHRHPLWFHAPDHGPLFFAGILDVHPDAPPTFAVLTTAARPPVREIHDRMPVVLSRDAARRFVLAGTAPRVPAVDVDLVARSVSPRVNSVAHDDPACIALDSGGHKQLGLF